MERREHYDPEDIESLLQERGFDELLEEERAYVLRHLSGREEYEAMRSLLYQVRDDERMHPPVQVGAEVKNAVMAAFRANQQPQWRIWLNSLGALLWPKEMSAMWRPALAIASLALLIVAGVQVTKYASQEAAQPQVAELKEPPAAMPNKEVVPLEPTPAAAESVRAATRNVGVATEGQVLHLEQAAVAEEAPAPVVAMDVNSEGDAGSLNERAEDLTTTQFKAVVADELKKAEAVPATVATGATTQSHQVTEFELARNASTANASGRTTVSAAKEKYTKKEDSPAALSGSPELLALLNTGW